jgi:lipopolysaccharide/colanic/teichoic acid biosynthesis glycosyltransferase
MAPQVSQSTSFILGESVVPGRWPAGRETASAVAVRTPGVRNGWHFPLVGARAHLRPTEYEIVKRLMDVVISTIGLILLSPLFAIVAAAVELSSPGPVFFRQVRIGRNGVPFEIIKFRTMRNGNSGPLVTSSGDARITPVGRALRRYKLDELPQLWNVLVGDMSLVGPRPQTPGYVKLFPREYSMVHTVRPGITDFATLHHRHEESILAGSPDPETTYLSVVLPEKFALQYRYIENMSFSTDVMLICRTVSALFR